ncbi:MAG: hypothetical protein RLZZ196_3099 [Bacteroidota bacterium]|jgi:hypothetical protein
MGLSAGLKTFDAGPTECEVPTAASEIDKGLIGCYP